MPTVIDPLATRQLKESEPPGGMAAYVKVSRSSTDVPEKYLAANDGKTADVFKVMSGAPDCITTCVNPDC